MTSRLSYTRGTLASGASPDGELVFTASAEGTNRYGFSLNKNRWKIDNFNANPVILWMHMDLFPPIGRGRASIDRPGLKTAVTFDRSDPFAVQIENKYRTGFLNAVSVGFDFVDAKGVPANRWDITPEEIFNDLNYDLAEVSAVPVPADPRALVRQRHALAMDFGLRLDEDEETNEWLRHMAGRVQRSRTHFVNPWDPYGLAGGPAAPAFPGMPTMPTLPGNSEMERRLQRIEDAILNLSAPAPVVENTPPAPPEPEDPTDPPAPTPEDEEQVDETLASSVLDALTLSGKEGS